MGLEYISFIKRVLINHLQLISKVRLNVMDKVNARASDSFSKGIKPHKKCFSMSQKKKKSIKQQQWKACNPKDTVCPYRIRHEGPAQQKIGIRLAFTSNDLTGIKQTMSRLCSTTISYHFIVNYSLVFLTSEFRTSSALPAYLCYRNDEPSHMIVPSSFLLWS